MNYSVSVVIPNYNRKDELLRAIDSVLEQSLKVVDILVVDDCSSFDITSFLNESYGNKIEEFSIKCIRNEVNKGAAASRNIGVSNAQGTLIAFLDSDDYWDKTKLEKQVKLFHSKSNLDLVYTNQVLKEDGQMIPSDKHLINDNLASALIQGWTAPNTSTLMFKKESFLKLDGFNEDLKSCQDHDLWFKVAKFEFNIDFIDEALSTFVLDSSDRISYNLKKRMNGVYSFLGIWKSFIIVNSSKKVFASFQRNYFYRTSLPIFVLMVKEKNFFKALSIYYKYLVFNSNFYSKLFSKFLK